MAYSTAKEAIDRMPVVFDAAAAKGFECVYHITITGDGGGTWTLTVKDGACTLQQGAQGKPTVALTMSDTTWLAIVNKKMNAMQAGMTGRVKTNGSMLAAQKIPIIFPL